MRRLLSTFLVSGFLFSAVYADTGIHEKSIKFAKGASSAVVDGRLQGEQTIDYVFRASAGQSIRVDLDKSNPSCYFNVLPPGSKDEAMFQGQLSESFKGVLPDDGDYRVRVYLVRAAARNNQSANFKLKLTITGKPLAAVSPKQDAVIPGTRYHAEGPIRAVIDPYGSKALVEAQGSVVRRGTDGTATVVVDLGKGRARRLLFVKGKVTSADTFSPFHSHKSGDVTTVEFDSGEKYEIPDVFIFGD